MKIVLIIPPHPFLGDQRRNAPLGIMYIASVLQQHNYDVVMVDLRSHAESEWLERIPEADVYGITCCTPDYRIVLKISKLIKDNYDACIVLGGAHGTAVPNTIDPLIDKVILGEGERAILDALQDYKNGVSKRFYKSPRVCNLDSLPFPARHLLPFKSVFNDELVEKGIFATTIITSRGCPYNCAFCTSKKMWGQNIQFRTPDNVISELKQIIKSYNVTSFRFQDDTIGINKKRLYELCKKIEPLEINWRANSRVDTSSYEVLTAMKQAGCGEINYGIESISQSVLNINRKNIKVEDIYKTLDNTNKVGLKVRLFFIIGLPGEEPGVADRLIEFIKKTQPDGVDLSTFVPYPGSDIHENPSEYGIELIASDYDDYVMTLGLGEGEREKDFTFKHPLLSNEELKEERGKILDFIQKYKLALNK